MTTNNQIQTWIEKNRLDVLFWDERTFTIKGFGKCFLIEPKIRDIDQVRIFDRSFELIISDEENEAIQNDPLIEYIVYSFGGKFYYAEGIEVIKGPTDEFKELKYVGAELNQWTDKAPPFLGIHGGYDLCNGSRDYKDWCKKAKFAGYKVLGIAEENTLAGTLAFQNACAKAKIDSVIGETVTVDCDGEQYQVKLYVEQDRGWKNLLLINAQINVVNNKFVTEEFLLAHSEQLFCVVPPDFDFKNLKKFQEADFHDVFYQLDGSKWDSEDRDKKMLLATQAYLKRHYPKVRPVLISDAFYLDKEDAKIRRDLNAIGKVSFKFQSADQYFKTPNQLFDMCDQFEDIEKGATVLECAMDAAEAIGCTLFRIETGKLYLPQYEMTDEEKSKYPDNKELFLSLLEDGIQSKLTPKGLDTDEYLDRLAAETEVILGANLHDYFLITWDILNWANRQGIRTGYGRGSAGGSLVAFLLGIVKSDPIKFGLIFERFLNEGRLYKKKKVKGWEVTDDEGGVSEWPEYPADADAMGFKITEKEIEIKVTGSMPDIDNDIQGGRRDEVKRYIESKYGANRVSGIGTYSTFKIKSALSDLARRSGTDSQYAKYVTGAIQDDPLFPLSFGAFFKYAQSESTYDKKTETVKDHITKIFIQENMELIQKLPLIFNQPKTASSHAAGVVIVPPSENGIYDQLPVKLVDGVLVSEWEMEYVEQAGFLKMDILGLKQLDKFSEIIDLIKETTGDTVVLEEVKLDDPKVYELFSQGFNEDVFQFGGFGLKGYTSSLQPENINDLIATTALYRPGPIEIGAHQQYINRKNGTEPVVFPFGTEGALQETYGLMCYQEQIMKITQDLSGFTLNEADDIRKAIGKKLPELMKSYEGRFIEGAVKNKCSPQEAKFLWDQIEVFGGYSFNKSHSVCYGITGYHSQWLKANYPLQFYTVSLRYSSEDQRMARLSEIRAVSDIKVSAADVNKSGMVHEMDVKTNTIYWTISSVKQAGPKAVAAILAERQANGPFFSVEEFAKRVKGGSDKRCTINLILSGAFDEIHGIDNVKQRYQIIEKYFTFRKEKVTEEVEKMKKWKEHHWIIEQRKLSGLGELDFKSLVHHTSLAAKVKNYRTCKEILETPAEELPESVLIAGLITKADIKGKQKACLSLEIDDGTALLGGMIWNDTYIKYIKEFTDPINKLICFNAPVDFDRNFRKANTFKSADRGTQSTIITIID